MRLTRALRLSSLSAVFTPSMTAFLPQMIEERELLQTTNGLMETTTRFARVIGPGLVAILNNYVPLVHYFTLDALSFFASAWSLFRIGSHSRRTDTGVPRPTFSLWAGYRLTKRVPVLHYYYLTGAIVGAAWLFIFPLGIALLVRENVTPDIGALGKGVFGYGVGNLTANLILANLPVWKPARMMGLGRIIGGIGFIFLALSHRIEHMMLACALAAVGGPMTDLGFVNLVQAHFRGADIARIFRFSMAMAYGCLLIVFLISPALFRQFSVVSVVMSCAVIILLASAGGVLTFWRDSD